MTARKRILTMGMVSILACAYLLSGCANGGSSSGIPSAGSTSSAGTSSQTAANTSSGPMVTITWYIMGNYPCPDQDAVMKAANDYLKTKLNAQLNVIPLTWGDYGTKMSVAIASRQQFDLCFTSDWINDFVANVSKGAFMPLDDLMKTDAPQTYASIPAAWWKAVSINGKIYGVINQQISARSTEITYATADAQKYNFDASTYVKGDLSSLDPFIAKMYAADPNRYVLVVDTTPIDFLGLDNPSGTSVPCVVDPNDPTSKVQDMWQMPAVKQWYATLQDWNAKGWQQSERRITLTTDPTSDITSGLVMLETSGTWKPGGDVEISKQNGFPTTDIVSGTPVLSTGGIQATLTAVSATSANPDMAMKVLELVNTDPELYNILGNGIEGVHYTLDSNKQMTFTDKQPNYGPGNTWAWGTNYMSYVSQGQPADVWEQTKQYNNAATMSPLLGFSFDPTPVKDDIAKVTAISTQYARGLQLGYYSTAQYDDMDAKLQAAGLGDIITEMQKQIDAWKASNTAS